MAFVILGKVAGNIVLLSLYPKWRKRYHYVVKKSHKKVLRPLFLNYVLVIMKNFASYGALTLAHPVALVLVVGDSAKPIVIFLMGIILSYISPKVGREELKFRPIIVHLIATVLLVVGIVILRQQYL